MNRIVAIVTTLLLLGACSQADTLDSGGDLAEPGAAVGGENSDGLAPEGEVVVDRSGSRMVVRTAALTIEAENTRATHDAVRDLVEGAGGFISAATIHEPQGREDQPRVHMVLRVPADDVSRFLEEIAALGTRLVTLSERGQDVTEEYVDVEARIANLTLLEQELRALLAEVRQNADADPAKLLQVFNEISRVRGEVELLEGRRRLLQEQVQLATVELQILPTPAVTPVVAEDWAPVTVARQALADLVASLQGIADTAIRLTVYALPLLLIFVALPGFLVWKLRHRLFRTGSLREVEPGDTGSSR